LNKTLLRATELAEQLSVSLRTIRSLSKDNAIPFIKLPGGRRATLYDLNAVVSALKKYERKSK